ncbi:hypothetical protein K1719_001339 [Acacia pycnantha]|nr:hypothetical protein K1719_001339 [Acacia pycnantha]
MEARRLAILCSHLRPIGFSPDHSSSLRLRVSGSPCTSSSSSSSDRGNRLRDTQKEKLQDVFIFFDVGSIIHFRAHDFLVGCILNSAIGRKKLNRKIGLIDTRVQTRKGIPMETERAVPNPRLVIDTSIRIQNGVASSTNKRIVGEHRQLSGWPASMACT